MSATLTWPVNEQRILDAAISASVRDTRNTGEKTLYKVMFHMLRSGRAAVKNAKANRRIQTGARGGKFYLILRQGKEPYRKYLNPSRALVNRDGGGTRETKAAFRRAYRERVKQRYRKVPRVSFAKSTFGIAIGMLGKASGRIVRGARRFVKVRKRLSGDNQFIEFTNLAKYIAVANPSVESQMIRRGALSFIGSFNRDLASALKRRFPES